MPKIVEPFNAYGPRPEPLILREKRHFLRLPVKRKQRLRSPERRKAFGVLAEEGPPPAKAARRWEGPHYQGGGSTSVVAEEDVEDDEGIALDVPFASLLGVVEEGPPAQQLEDLSLEEQQQGEKGAEKGVDVAIAPSEELPTTEKWKRMGYFITKKGQITWIDADAPPGTAVPEEGITTL